MTSKTDRFKQGAVFGGTLFLCLLLNSCILTGGEDKAAAEGPDSIGLSSKSFIMAGISDTNAMIDVVSGNHPVGIYCVPSGKTTGKGTLQIARNGNQTTMSLKNAAGASLASMSFDRANPPAYSWLIVTPAIGKLHMSISGNTWNAFDAGFGTDGFISGYVGYAPAIYYFRNNLAAYGSHVPDVFPQISGTWKGPQEAATCLTTGIKPDVTVTIAATGLVSIAGRGNQTCKDTTITSQWDGQDDYIAPLSGGGYDIYLDSQKGGAAQPSGGIRIRVSTLKNPSGISEVATTLAWVDGDISALDPQKQ